MISVSENFLLEYLKKKIYPFIKQYICMHVCHTILWKSTRINTYICIQIQYSILTFIFVQISNGNGKVEIRLISYSYDRDESKTGKCDEFSLFSSSYKYGHCDPYFIICLSDLNASRQVVNLILYVYLLTSSIFNFTDFSYK